MSQISRFFFSILYTTRRECNSYQIAGAISLGMIAGMTPPFTVHWGFFLFLLLFVRVNLLLGLFTYAFFAIVTPYFDFLTSAIGWNLLVDRKALTELWIRGYHSHFLPYTRFNNTVVLGNFILSLGLGIPLFFFLNWILSRKRAEWKKRIRGGALWAYCSSTRFYHWYGRNKSEWPR